MTDKEFMGKNALLTGGLRGMGGPIALKLVRRGADIAVNYLKRNDEARATQ